MSCKSPLVNKFEEVLSDTDAEHIHRHKSIIAYTSENGFPKTAATLRKELDIPEEFDAAAVKKYQTLLQKKWTTTARLQRKASRTYR